MFKGSADLSRDFSNIVFINPPKETAELISSQIDEQPLPPQFSEKQCIVLRGIDAILQNEDNVNASMLLRECFAEAFEEVIE